MNNLYKKYSLSNIFIGISVLFTIIATVSPNFYIFGMNSFFLDNGKYHIFIIQFFSSTFIHGGIFHLFFNSMFIYYFGNQVELILGRNKYLVLYVFNAIFVGIGLTILNEGNTVGISSFCLSLLTYFTLDLRAKKIDEYKGGVTAIILNILIGLHPQISLMGHLLGVIAGLIFYLLNKTFLRKLMTPIN